MFSGFNSEALKISPQTREIVGLDFESLGTEEIVACPQFDSGSGFESKRVDYSGLIQADGTPFPSAAAHQPIFASAFNLAKTSGWPGDVLIGTNGVYWPKLDSLNLYVNQIEQQLVGYQSDLSKLHAHLLYVPVPDYFSDYWPDEFESLYSQANQLGVVTSRLRRARRLAAWNAAQACRFLASEIRNAITEKIAHLRRRLRVAKALKSKLLRLVASVYQFRNQIILQRRYYLAHGSHPIVNPTGSEVRRSLDQRGCVPAFQQ
jgi:hypothetical protein